MAHEITTQNNGLVSYVCCTQIDQSDIFKQYYAFIRPAGYGQKFSSIKHDIQFPLTIFNEEQYGCTIKDQLYPIIIICKAINIELKK